MSRSRTNDGLRIKAEHMIVTHATAILSTLSPADREQALRTLDTWIYAQLMDELHYPEEHGAPA